MDYKEDSNKNSNDKSEEEGEDYAFLQETIKQTTGFRDKTKKIIKLALGGVLFGACACLGFCALKPTLEVRLNKETSTVTIPQDVETGDAEDVPEAVEPELQTALTAENYAEVITELNEITRFYQCLYVFV